MEVILKILNLQVKFATETNNTKNSYQMSTQISSQMSSQVSLSAKDFKDVLSNITDETEVKFDYTSTVKTVYTTSTAYIVKSRELGKEDIKSIEIQNNALSIIRDYEILDVKTVTVINIQALKELKLTEFTKNEQIYNQKLAECSSKQKEEDDFNTENNDEEDEDFDNENTDEEDEDFDDDDEDDGDELEDNRLDDNT